MNSRAAFWFLLSFALLSSSCAQAAEPFPVTVTVDAKAPVRPVPPLLFGHNNEWPNSGDGFWNAASNSPQPQPVALAKSVHPALVRFPGGSLSNYYHWADGIGPVAQRKPGTNYTTVTSINGQWTVKPQLKPMVYGFDEHMRLVKALGAAGALVTVNATEYPGSPEWSGSAQEAAAWVAYANARSDGPDVVIGKDSRGKDWRTSRYWARQRGANGHPAPYGVRYWEIGNEIDDRTQGAGLTGPTYARRVQEFARAMRAVDRTVQIGAVLGMDWLPDILRGAGGDIDFLIYHFYGPRMDDRGATLFSNAAVTAQVQGIGKPETLTVDASGTPASGVWPEMVVSIDGQERGRFTVNQPDSQGQSGHYPLDVTLGPGAHTVTVAFTNDVQTATEDRNLFVHQVTLGAGDQARLVSFATPTEVMQRLAGLSAQFSGGFDQVRAALHQYAPARAGHIQVFVTEFNAMYNLTGPQAQQIKDLKSALMVDSLLQRALAEPLCPETNYWSLTSWWFRIVEPGPPSPYLSPVGYVYNLLTEFHQGAVLRASVQGPSFDASPRFPSAPIVTAVAVRQGRHLAVNLVNFSPDRDAQVTLALRGFTPRGFLRSRILTGPTLDAMNEPDAPTRVHEAETTVPVTRSPLVITLPAHSAATVELSD